MSYSTTSHLGDLGAALVDDQLQGQLREQVLVHVAGCDPCRRDVDEQRRLKARLRSLAGPGLPPGLASRLGALGDGGTNGHLAAAPLPVPVPAQPVALRTAVRPVESRPPEGRPPGRTTIVRDPRRSRRLLVGAASLLLVGAGTAFAGGGDIQGATPSNPAANTFDTRTTSVSNVTPVSRRMPLNDPAFEAMTASFGR